MTCALFQCPKIELCLIPMPLNSIVPYSNANKINCAFFQCCKMKCALFQCHQIRLTQELGLMSLYCKYKYMLLARLVVLLAKPKTGFCDHKRETHNESRLHNERRGKNDHCFARSIMTLVEMLHVP